MIIWLLPISVSADIHGARTLSALKEEALAITTQMTEPTQAHAADQELAAAARDDFAAFERLYRRYVTRVYRYCYSRTSNSADAEDLTSQTFLAALEAIGSYRGRGSFAAWLFGIARRKCQDFHRRRYRQREEPLEAAQPLPDRHGQQLESRQLESRQLESRQLESRQLESQAYGHEILDCVQRHWRLLSADRREVVLLRFWAGLNTAETAQVMGRSRGAVKMLLSRAIADIRERCLDE